MATFNIKDVLLVAPPPPPPEGPQPPQPPDGPRRPGNPPKDKGEDKDKDKDKDKDEGEDKDKDEGEDKDKDEGEDKDKDKGEDKDKDEGEDKDKDKGEDKDKDGDPSEEEIDIDKITQEIEEKLKKRKELKDEKEANIHKEHPDFTPATRSVKSGEAGIGGGVGQITGKTDPYAHPKYNWKQLVKQMIPSGIPEPVSSYAKPSRKAATSMHIAGQTGSAALPPGMRADTQDVRKLAFVFDSSGTMYQTINKVMAEIPTLLKSSNFDAAPIGIVYFAGDMRLFVVNMKANTYQEVPSLEDMSNVDSRKYPAMKNWRHVLTLAAGGGTEFKPGVLLEIVKLINQGYNIVFFSDSDILADQNWANFVYLTVKHREHLAFIADSKDTWRSICQKLKMNLPRFGHLD